jgi:hypothetical protein
MNFKDAENQIDHADSFLEKLWKFLGKHWGKLIILLLIYLGYKFAVLVGKEMEKEHPSEETVEESTVINEYYLLDENGDTLIIREWSDNFVDTVPVNQ